MTDRLSSSAAPWTRAHWLDYADRLLAGVRRWASPNHARITPPGAEGGYGHAVDGLEGFARTFLLAGFRIAGDRGEGSGYIDELIDFYVRGLRAGVDPASPERWVRLEEHDQAKVEAASLALILDMTRPWIWDRLDEATRARLVDYLSPAVGDATYPPTNWLWFRVVVQTFLRSVGGPWSAQDIADDLARHDSMRRADGWITDGPERSFDHYVGWALHLYPVLWSRMRGAADLAEPGRTARDTALLDGYLADALALVGADGSPLIQGRSLIYRFAAAAPFWAGVLAEVPSHTAGALRHAAEKIVRHFADRGIPGDDGVLTMGWHGEWRRLAQGYSGPGSPYWAVKGLVGISLPADHPVWSAPADPLPAEMRDTVRAIASPGWLVSGTAADGIVRVLNHGTDHAVEGALTGDSPLYARLGYSTATAPLHDGEAWREPLDQSVTLVDALGRATHRAGMRLAGARVDAGAAVAASTANAHWIDPAPQQVHHGSGIAGESTVAGELYTASIVRGPWELRLVHVGELAADIDPSTLLLRIGGWPVAADSEPHGDADDEMAAVRTGVVVSGVRSLLPGADYCVLRRDGASPLGPRVAVPVVEFDVEIGAWYPVLVILTGAVASAAATLGSQTAQAQLADDGGIVVTWPDGATTAHTLPDPPIAQRATGSPQIGPVPAGRNREGEAPV